MARCQPPLGREAIVPLSEVDRRRIRTASLFGLLPDEEAILLIETARTATFAKGQTLFLEGDPGEAFFVVLEGWAVLSRDTTGGVRTLIKLVGPGESFAESMLAPDARYPVTGEAATPLRVARFSTARFRALVTHSPDLGLSIVAATFRQMHRLLDQIEHLKSWSVERRVADMLLQIYTAMGSPGGGFTLPVEQTLIANRLAITPSTFSRSLRKLAPLGVNACRGRITLDDPARLAAYAAAAES